MLVGRPDADRVVVVVSDVEMGSGGPTDDFPHTSFLADVIRSYATTDRRVDLVFNGDTFDFLKTPLDGKYPIHIDAGAALRKLHGIARAHGVFFDALGDFLNSGHRERKVWFVTGNHDVELLFPEVQTERARLIGVPNKVEFPGFELELGEVHIEHGSQADPLFRVDPARPFIEHQGRRILNLPWAAVALLESMLPLHPDLCFLERVKPRNELFALIPEARELLLKKARRYYGFEFWRDYLHGADPLKRLSWPMIKEVIYRFTSEDSEVSTGEYYHRALRSSDHQRLYVVGHRHEAEWCTYDDRKLLQTGCLRSEYILRDGGARCVPLPKIYAEVFMRDDTVIRSHLVELAPPPDPPGYVPQSIFDLRPIVSKLLNYEMQQKGGELTDVLGMQ